jgi:hypothetical protein
VVEDAQSRAGRSVLKLRIWLAKYPLAMAPAWAVLAGALAAGRLHWRREDGLQLLGALLLADGLWGQLWALLVPEEGSVAPETALPGGVAAPVPYSSPQSPLSRFWRWLTFPGGSREGVSPVEVWRAAVLALLSTVALAWLLGPIAMAMTALSLLDAVLARFLRATGPMRALVQAIFEIGLPWLLALRLFGEGGWHAGPLAVASGFVLVQAGAQVLPARSGRWLITLGQLAPLVWLLTADKPLMAGALAIVLLAPLAAQPWLVLDDERESYSRSFHRLTGPWWLAGMLLAGWAAGY